MKILINIIFPLVFTTSMAQSITSTGSWIPSVPVVTEAGTNYSSGSLQSSTSQTLIDISMPNSYLVLILILNHYTVKVKRTDTGPGLSAAGLQLYVKRTGDGTGGGAGLLIESNITGGNTTFIELTTSDQTFFSGNNYGTTPRINIPIQYQITGISVLVPVANYTTTITYTLTDD